MTQDTELVDQPVTNIDKLVEVYIKIRDARDEVRRELEVKEADLNEQLEIISQQILEVCKQTGADSIKTQHGTAMRGVKSRFWTNDWEKFYEFLFEQKTPELLERRIHQTNMKQFLEENPDKHPAGLNVERTYAITVRRSK
jgi:hypothetical protein